MLLEDIQGVVSCQAGCPLWQAQDSLSLHPAVAGEHDLCTRPGPLNCDEVAEPGVIHNCVLFVQFHKLQWPQVLGNVEVKLLLLRGPHLIEGIGRSLSVAEPLPFVEPQFYRCPQRTLLAPALLPSSTSNLSGGSKVSHF